MDEQYVFNTRLFEHKYLLALAKLTTAEEIELRSMCFKVQHHTDELSTSAENNLIMDAFHFFSCDIVDNLFLCFTGPQLRPTFLQPLAPPSSINFAPLKFSELLFYYI